MLHHSKKYQSEISLDDQQSQAKVNLQKHEVLQLALECIKAGVTPTITGKQTNKKKQQQQQINQTINMSLPMAFFNLNNLKLHYQALSVRMIWQRWIRA